MNVILIFLACLAWLIFVFVATTALLNMFSSYANGRKAGGYPIFAKWRSRTGLKDWAYKRGVAKSRDKIAKGGYK